MKTILETKMLKNILSKYGIAIQIFFTASVFLLLAFVWHYSNVDDADSKLYAFQAMAEILVAAFETIATFLMIKSIRQNGEANREMKKMNEKLQFSMVGQSEVLKKQQEFYEMQIAEKKKELEKQEKIKILNRYLYYVRNFLFAYNRKESFDGVDTSKFEKQNDIDVTEKHKTNATKDEQLKKKEQQFRDILAIRLTPNVDLKNYIFLKEKVDKKGKTTYSLELTGNDRDVKEKFDALLREYKHKLRTKLPPILENYFSTFETNEELQELCG